MEPLIGSHQKPPADQTAGDRVGPPLPTSTSEQVNAVIHYYRGEMGRMTSWRDRIDRTSNWAITVVAALLSISLSTPSSHHGVILFGMLLVSLLLIIEARRYRFFDIYRGRIRQLERCYFAQVLSPQAELNSDWASAIAQSLRKPTFLISYRQALVRRIRRNYCWMYLILIMAWGLKVGSCCCSLDHYTQPCSSPRRTTSLTMVNSHLVMRMSNARLRFGWSELRSLVGVEDVGFAMAGK